MISPVVAPQRRPVQLVTVALVLVIAACGTSSEAESPGSESEPAEAAAVRADLVEIVAGAQRAMILAERAGNVLIARCMEEKGFEFHGPTITDVGGVEHGLTVGSLTPESAQEDGYGAYLPSSMGPDPTDPLLEAGREYYESLSPDDQQRYTEVLMGRGDEDSVVLESGIGINMGGCLGQSRRELLGDRVLEVYEVFNTVQFLRVDVSEDPAVREAERAWRSCVQASGYRFERPAEAVAAGVVMRGDAIEPSPEEIALAVADAECRVESGIVQAAEEAFGRLNQEMLRENERLLASWAAMERYVLERSGEVLGVDLTADP